MERYGIGGKTLKISVSVLKTGIFRSGGNYRSTDVISRFHFSPTFSIWVHRARHPYVKIHYNQLLGY